MEPAERVTYEPYDPDRDEAPPGTDLDCAGEDPDEEDE